MEHIGNIFQFQKFESLKLLTAFIRFTKRMKSTYP